MAGQHEEWLEEMEIEAVIAERLQHERHPDQSVDGEDRWDIDYFDEGDCE